ncbi:Uncharacterised protein [Chlamydia trachomatis]|nr:Uncharacterised protein [Chlamydia trachomatis]
MQPKNNPMVQTSKYTKEVRCPLRLAPIAANKIGVEAPTPIPKIIGNAA